MLDPRGFSPTLYNRARLMQRREEEAILAKAAKQSAQQVRGVQDALDIIEEQIAQDITYLESSHKAAAYEATARLHGYANQIHELQDMLRHHDTKQDYQHAVVLGQFRISTWLAVGLFVASLVASFSLGVLVTILTSPGHPLHP